MESIVKLVEVVKVEHARQDRSLLYPFAQGCCGARRRESLSQPPFMLGVNILV
jgi:hypothetical protein